MKKKTLCIVFFITVAYLSMYAQLDSTVIASQLDVVSLGLGGGFDYGGFGANILVYPQNNIGLFVGGGYAMAGFGYNVGTKIRFSSRETFHRFTFYLTAMYGYNAAVKVTNASQYDKLFYGPTFGCGLDYKAWPEKRGYWTFALLVPIRDSEVDDYIDDLKNNHGVEFESGLIPIGFSIGYRFIFN